MSLPAEAGGRAPSSGGEPTAAPPDLSVIIVNWKSTYYLRNCLATIYRDGGLPAAEVIVVDNASDDGCGGLLALQYPQVRFIQSAVNLGFAGANNLAALQSRGSTLLFLNPDTELIGPVLSIMHRLLWETPGAGALGCRLLNTDGSLQTSCIQAFPTIANQALNAEALRRLFPLLFLWGTRPLFERSEEPRPVEVVSGACLMVKRHVFEEAGRFSTSYFMYAEDADLCFTIRSLGYAVCYTSAATVIHHGGGSSAQRERTYFSDVVMCESLFRLLTKCRGRRYGALYRLTIGGTACFRVVLIGGLLSLALRRPAQDTLRRALGKWISILRWSLGYEGWARGLAHAAPALDGAD